MITPLIVPGFRSAFWAPGIESAPGRRSNADNLWSMARFMFETITLRIASIADLARRNRFPNKERRGMLNRIEPVEKITRNLLVVRAITWLLMTVPGRKLLAATPKMAMPERPKPPERDPRGTTSIRMPYPGWTTIARPWRPAPPAPPPAPEKPRLSPLDPASWTCPFRVFGWVWPETEATHPPRKPLPQAYALLKVSLQDPHILRSPKQHREPKERSGYNIVATALAHRLEAVGRVLADPEPHIRRLARLIARLPRGMLRPDDAPATWWAWSQGHDEYKDAFAMANCAIRALNRTEGVDPEPG